MRPLRLTIEGLHSFRERQEIPFEPVADAGLFGMFGPTGSGKATILDAITLALFGTVVRASLDTQGILNQGENKLSVSFRFALGTAPRRVFQAERQYRRHGEHSVRNSLSRLLELDPDGNATVLADRDGEVTAMVHGLLGLDKSDLTRAVVLPQGRFADFLQLRAADRRQMMQRLFGLEVYGNRLTEKFKLRRERTERRHASVSSEQAGLGQASWTDLESARQALRDARGQSEGAEAGLREVRTRHQAAQRVWECQSQLAGVEEQFNRHGARGEEMAAVSGRIGAAARAGRLWPLLEAERNAVEREADAGRQAEAQQAVFAELAGRERRLLDRQAAARQERLEHEPRLRVRLRDLEQAVALEAGVAQIRSGHAAILEELREVQTRENELARRSGEQEAERSGLTTRQVESQVELRRQEVSPDEEQRLSAALDAAGRLKAARETCGRARQEWEAKEKAAAESRHVLAQAETEKAAHLEQGELLRSQLADLDRCPPPDSEQLARRGLSLHRLEDQGAALLDHSAQLRQLEAELAGLRSGRSRLAADLAGARENCERLAKLLDDRQRQLQEAQALDHQVLAYRLAVGLELGQPCPVCGSREHPRLAEDPGEATLAARQRQALEKELRKTKQELAETQQRRDDAITILARHDAAVESRDRERRDLAARVETGCAGLASAWPGPASWPGLDGLAAALAGMKSALEADRETTRQWQDRRQEAADRLAQLEGIVLRDAKVARAAAEARWGAAVEAAEAAARVRTGAEETLVAAGRELQPFLDEWGDAGGDPVRQGPERVADRQADHQRRRRRAGELRGELERLERGLLECAAAERGIQAERQSLEVQRAGLTATLAEKDRQLQAEQAHLAGITGGEPVAGLVREAQQELERLAETEQRLAGELERLQTEKAGAELDLSKLQALRLDAAGRLAGCRRQLEQGLSAEGAGSAAEVMAGRLEESELGRLSAELEAYRQEGQRLHLERGRLLRQLDGQAVAAAEWEALGQELARAEADSLRLAGLEGQARQQCADLESRHGRWVQLETERQALDEELGLLRQLEQLLRGNRFVDFVGESQMGEVTRMASDRLRDMTRHRYALEVLSDGGFVVRDDANGGVRRLTTSLSGGELFQVSLGLALALSTQVQLRGQHPLEFFFLDEGFGSLDPAALDDVMSTLERLPRQRMMIGLITHVSELRQRLGRSLLVRPAEPGGRGTTVELLVR